MVPCPSLSRESKSPEQISFARFSMIFKIKYKNILTGSKIVWSNIRGETFSCESERHCLCSDL